MAYESGDYDLASSVNIVAEGTSRHELCKQQIETGIVIYKELEKGASAMDLMNRVHAIPEISGELANEALARITTVTKTRKMAQESGVSPEDV